MKAGKASTAKIQVSVPISTPANMVSKVAWDLKETRPWPALCLLALYWEKRSEAAY